MHEYGGRGGRKNWTWLSVKAITVAERSGGVDVAFDEATDQTREKQSKWAGECLSEQHRPFLAPVEIPAVHGGSNG